MAQPAQTDWQLYVLRCGDGSYYTGITTDVQRRLAQHRAGKGARYTAMRPPLDLVGLWRYPDHSTALKEEAAFKALPRPRKAHYIEQRLPFHGAPFALEAVS